MPAPGTCSDDVLCGLGDNDVLLGGGGNDTIRGGLGRDQCLADRGDTTSCPVNPRQRTARPGTPRAGHHSAPQHCDRRRQVSSSDPPAHSERGNARAWVGLGRGVQLGVGRGRWVIPNVGVLPIVVGRKHEWVGMSITGNGIREWLDDRRRLTLIGVA